MRILLRRAVTCVAILASAVAHAEDTFWACAKVIHIASPTELTLGFGSAEGASTRTWDVDLLPMRMLPGANSASVDFNVRLAHGRVVATDEHTARVQHDVAPTPVKVGDVGCFSIPQPKGVTRDVVFELAALSIELRTLEEDKPIYALAGYLADHGSRARAAVLAAMVAELRKWSSLAKEVLPTRIKGGRYHSRTLDDVFANAIPDDILAFFEFVAEYPGRYINHRWKLCEVFATWIINGTPSGGGSRLNRQLTPDLLAAKKAAGAGLFDVAEKKLRAVLTRAPDNDDAKTALAWLDKLALARRTLASDPNDLEAHYLALTAYDHFGADVLVENESAVLSKAAYRVGDVARLRAFSLFRQLQYLPAAEAFELASRGPPAWPDGKSWADVARANAKTRGGEVNLVLAQAYERLGHLDTALSHYRRVLADPKSSQSFDLAMAGQTRISARRDLDFTRTGLETSIRGHTPSDIKKRLEGFLGAAQQAETPQLGAWLGGLSDVAAAVAEPALSVELARRRVAVAPSPAALQALAWALYRSGALDAALAEADAALTSHPENVELRHYVATFAFAKGDLARAEREATVAAQSPKYAWPRLLLARVAAERGRLPRTLELTAEALKLLPDDASVQLAWSAARTLTALPAERARTPRQTLTAVRAWLELGVPRLARRGAASLNRPPTIAFYRDAAFALASMTEADRTALAPAERLAFARAAAGDAPERQRLVRRLAAEAALGAQDTPDHRVALARAELADGRFHLALAALGPLLDSERAEAADLAQLARKGLAVAGIIETARESVARRDYTGAERLHREAMRGYTEVGHRLGALEQATSLAWVLAQRGRVAEAHQELKAVLAGVASVPPSPRETLGARLQLGYLDSQLGNLPARGIAVAEAAALCEALDDLGCQVAVARDCAQIALDEGRITDAERAAGEALALAERTGNRVIARGASETRADVAWVAGDLAAAKTRAEALLRESRSAMDSDTERTALTLLGGVAMKQGDVKLARERFQAVYKLGQRTADPRLRAMARSFEGHALLDAARDATGARKAFDEAATLYRRVQAEVDAATALLGVARSAHASGDAAGARKALDDAEAVARAKKATLLLANVLIERALQSTKDTAADSGARALAAAEEAQRIAKATDHATLRWAADHALGRALAKAGRTTEALEAYERAIALITGAATRSGNEDAQTGFFRYGTVRRVVQDAIDLLLSMNRANRALELIELTRDAELRRMFDPSKIRTTRGDVNQTLKGLSTAQQQAEAVQRSIDAEFAKPEGERNVGRLDALAQVAARTDGEVRQILNRLMKQNGRLYRQLTIDPRSVVKSRELLPPDALVLQYFVAPDALYAFAVMRSSAEARAVRVDLSSRDIDRAVMNYLASVQSDPATALEQARKLFGWLLRPFEAELKQAHTVLIAPSKSLNYLPFHALVTTPEGQPPAYVIERHRVAYISSLTFDELSKPARTGRPTTFIAFANPDLTLDGARDEVDAIQKQANFAEYKVLYGNEATESQAKALAGQFQIVHFATHGVLDPANKQSYLKMASGEVLDDNDIVALKLDGTRLIVLSACSTAVAPHAAADAEGEGVSIAEAFASAEAPALVASLWDVDDKATRELMTSFYKRLGADPKKDTLDALREAQLHVLRLERDGIREFEDPRYWAAFELIGDYR